jgi:hypothetical protein
MVWLGQLVRHWVVESWTRKHCFALGGPGPYEVGVEKLRGARADQSQAASNDRSYRRSHAGDVCREAETGFGNMRMRNVYRLRKGGRSQRLRIVSTLRGGVKH